jgi:hypothetical protein
MRGKCFLLQMGIDWREITYGDVSIRRLLRPTLMRSQRLRFAKPIGDQQNDSEISKFDSTAHDRDNSVRPPEKCRTDILIPLRFLLSADSNQLIQPACPILNNMFRTAHPSSSRFLNAIPTWRDDGKWKISLGGLSLHVHERLGPKQPLLQPNTKALGRR